MSFSSNTIQDALYDWVFGIAAVTTVWRYLNAPLPNAPFMTLNMTGFQKIGWDYQSPTNDAGKAALYGNREFILEINYYGSGGLDKFEKLTTSLQSFPVNQQLAASGIVYVDKVSQQNVTELVESAYEERHMMELRFRVSNQGITDPDLFDTGIISTVEIAGENSGGVIDPEDLEVTVGDPYTPPEEP